MTDISSWLRGRTRLLKEGLWVAFGQTGAILGTLVGVRLLTELLTPQVFGEVTLLIGMAALAYAVASGPFLQAVLRSYPESVRDGTVSVLRLAARRQLLISGMWITGIWLLGWTIYSLTTDVTIWLGYLLVPLLALDIARSLEIAFFNAARRQRPMALWTTAEAWARPAMAALAVIFVGASAQNVLTSYILASTLIFFVFAALTQREGIQTSLRVDAKAIQIFGNKLVKYALPLLPIGIISWVSNQADRYVIGGVLGIEQTGLYAAAYGIASRPAMALCGIVETTLRPVYFQAVTSGDVGRIRRIFIAWLGLVSVIATVIFAVFALFSQPIAWLLLGEQYRSSAFLIPLIAAGYSLLAIAQVFAGAMYARHNTHGVMITETSGAVARFFFGAVGVYFFGITGVAVSVPVAFGVQFLVALVLTARQQSRA